MKSNLKVFQAERRLINQMPLGLYKLSVLINIENQTNLSFTINPDGLVSWEFIEKYKI